METGEFHAELIKQLRQLNILIEIVAKEVTQIREELNRPALLQAPQKTVGS
jgi:hypothetical protein